MEAAIRAWDEHLSRSIEDQPERTMSDDERLAAAMGALPGVTVRVLKDGEPVDA